MFQSNQLPKINASTSQLWGETFAKRVIAFAEAHKKFGRVMLSDISKEHIAAMRKAGFDLSGMQLENRGEYKVHDFLCDSFIGDLPWTSPDSQEVERVLEEVEGYLEAKNYLIDLDRETKK